MNTQSSTFLRCLTSLLATAGLAAALATVAPPTAEAQRGRAAANAPAQSAEGVVNIQTASVEELQRLPGVGPSKAEAIVAQRDRRAFRRVEDILRVRGIGRSTFRRLRSMLTVEGPTTLAGSQPRSRRAPASASDGADAADDEGAED